jgi:predicted MFS family arabinose efflux permease
MPTLGKLLIISGVLLIAIGLLLYLFGKAGFLGRLPGDIYIEKKNFTFYFPLATCALLSLFLTLFFWLFSRR